MKLLKYTIGLFALTVCLISCSRDLGFTPDGNSLELSLTFPGSGTDRESRLIHSESDQLTISLTYPDGSVIEQQFDRNNSDTTLDVLVEDLEPADGVELYVSLGLKEFDLVLSEARDSIDIEEGKTVLEDLTLQAVEYEISGTLKDESGYPITDLSSVSINGTDFQLDKNGNYKFTLSTEMADHSYVINYIYGGEINLNFVRTGLDVLKNWNNFEIQIQNEMYLDFYVYDYNTGLPVSGATVTLEYYYSPDFVTVPINIVSDSTGHIFFHSINHPELDFNNQFEFYTMTISYPLLPDFVDYFYDIDSSWYRTDDIQLDEPLV